MNRPQLPFCRLLVTASLLAGGCSRDTENARSRQTNAVPAAPPAETTAFVHEIQSNSPLLLQSPAHGLAAHGWRFGDAPLTLQITNLPSGTRAYVVGSNDLVLLEVKAGTFEELWLTNILQNRLDISTKLEKSRSAANITSIAGEDFHSMARLLAVHPDLSAFVPVSFGGHSVLVYPRFVVVALQGTIHENPFYVYFIRIPGGNWELLYFERR